MSSTGNQQIGWPCLEFNVVTSTLDLAREHAERGAPHGTLITASHQTGGRGRRGAAWLDQPGASALMTFILDADTLQSAQLWRIGFIASLACGRALRELGYGDLRLKWPNDLAIDGRKLGGLIVENVPHPQFARGAFLLGIGINVEQEEFPGSDEYVLTPISLRMASGTQPVPNARQVIDRVAAQLDAVWSAHIDSGDALIDEWRQYQLVSQLQRGVELATGETVSGVYSDVRAADGAGLVEIEGCAGLTAIAPAAS